MFKNVLWCLVSVCVVVAAPAAAQTRPSSFPSGVTPPVLAKAARAAAVAPSGAQDPAPAPQGQPMPAGGGRVFNPDISVITNFLAVTGKNAFNTAPTFSLNEAEVAFQSVVDPYAKADIYLSATPEGVDVEEAAITFTTLPGKFLVKVGKLRANIGKVNTLHTHALPYADRPLVSQNLVGGEDGMADSGVSVSRLLATSALFLEATGEVFAARTTLFTGDTRSRLAYVGRLRAYKDLSESSNLDAGGSFAFGPTDIGPESNRTLYAADVTFRYRPLRRAIYRRFNLRSEMVWSRSDGARPSDAVATAFGIYGLAELQYARRWYVGARVDRSGRADAGTRVDTGVSAFLTYWPSEFSQLRGQFRRTSYAERVTGNEFLVQLNFSIGAHGAHVF